MRENLLLREEYTARYGFPRIVGEHTSIREISQQIQRVAATDSTVLLLGESGTGKELFARAVHHLSPRREQPFVALNCAAIPEGLVENELFGHERGAFTGAGARKVGKLDLAHRGTLFLDEIGELPLAIQAKLLARVGRTEIRARWRHASRGSGCADRGGDESQSRKADGGEALSRRFVLPDFGGADDDSSSARARQRRAAAGPTLFGKIQPRICEARAGAFGRRERAAAALPLAGECARTAKHHGAGRDPDGWAEHYSGRVAIAVGATGCGSLPAGMLPEQFQLGRIAGRE